MPRFGKLNGKMLLVGRYSPINKTIAQQHITDGHVYEWMDPSDGDHGEHLGFDRANNRVYYHHHSF